jgi:ATP-dependent exoDNAse (exonuclease V) beta subunit
VPLATNYRSRQNILDIAYEFISTEEGFSDSTDNVKLIASRPEGSLPIVLFHPDAEEDKDAEAEALAAWIEYLTRGAPIPALDALDAADTVKVDDVAVLLRSLKPSHGLPAIERAFERRGIPYAVIGGANAAETRALTSWHAVMSLLLPGNRVRELLTVLEGDPWNVPDAVLWELIRDVKRRPGGIDLLGDEDIERIGDDAAAARVHDLRTLVEDLSRRMVSTDLRSGILWAIHESPLAMRLFAQASHASVWRAVQDLVVAVLEAFEEVAGSERPAGLASFLEHLRAAIDDKKFREESDMRLPDGRVRVMTIHQAKGLEFPAVAVAGVKPPYRGGDRFFVSHDHGVYFSAQEAKEWKRGLADSKEAEHERRMEDQEAHCLFYVAMTRAQDHLWVSSPFREGRRQKSESLFTKLIGCVDRVSPLVILREPPDTGLVVPVEAAPDAPADGAVSPDELEASLLDVDASRTRLESIREATAPSSHALDIVTWPEIYVFNECPLKYRYRFHTRVADLLGADDNPRGEERRDVAEGVALPGGMGPADYGVLVHAALERCYGERQDPGDAVMAAAAAMGRVNRAVTKAVRKLLDGVLSSEVGKPGARLATEMPFEVRFESMVVHGVMDRVEVGEEGWRVIDYKVGVENPAHDFQVQLYAWALGRIHDEPATGVLCYLRERGAHVKRAATPDSAPSIEALATRLERSLASGDFAPNPGEVCASCAYRVTCPFASG